MHSKKRNQTEVAQKLCGQLPMFSRHDWLTIRITTSNWLVCFHTIYWRSYLNYSRYSELEDSGPLTEGLWARASAASAFTYLEKRAFGIADDM